MPLEDLLASLPEEMLVRCQEFDEDEDDDNGSHGEPTSIEKTKSHSPAEEEIEAAAEDGKSAGHFD